MHGHMQATFIRGKAFLEHLHIAAIMHSKLMLGHGLHGSPVPHKLQLFMNPKAQRLRVGAAQKALHIKCIRSCMSKILLCFVSSLQRQLSMLSNL
jgi:hypothetical protein